MMATSRPGSTACADAAVTCASTLPTATAIPSGRPVQAAARGGERAGPGAEGQQRTVQLGHEVAEPGLSAVRKSSDGVLTVLQDALVAGRADVAGLGAAELPDDPVGRLDEALGPVVDLGVLLQHLQTLGVLPLGGDLAAVPADPRLGPLVGQRVDPVGVRLRRVVLPQLDPGVRPVAQLGILAERGAVGGRRQHRAGGEVDADADDRRRIHPCGGHRRRDGVPQHVAVVLRVLQGPVRGKRSTSRKRRADHCVAVLVHRGPQLGTITDTDHQSSPGQGAVVDTDDVAVASSVHTVHVHLHR